MAMSGAVPLFIAGCFYFPVADGCLIQRFNASLTGEAFLHPDDDL